MSSQGQLPNEVSPERREAIMEALELDQFDWFEDGARHLDLYDIDPEDFVFDEVMPYLDAGYRLYVLPGDPGRKSQCCIELESELVIHVKFTERPDGDGLFITFGFHRHNTGYAPLPK